MIKFANAKINLGLLVHEKRQDGFHEIESVMVPIPIYDALEFLPSKDFALQVIGKEISGDLESNLITRAFRLVQKETNCPNVKVILQKNIPMGAGLGGGSSDAAFTILGLNEFFDLKMSESKMSELAAQLGSDCPFFIKNSPQIARGRGEELKDFKLNLNGIYLHLICPDAHVSTADAYAGIVPERKEIDWKKVLSDKLPSWKKNLVNDFEKTIFNRFPELDEVKKRLYDNGADLALMSGSGSSIFGLYSSRPNSLTKNIHPEWILEL
ncbi:MAG: 4-diphosphocytidyl-2-C-methyl-D-erythritol kinase [Psychromonas sp.]|jgi:4-diphosphocytidyl-2-C-methyl-D-erythritol kinase